MGPWWPAPSAALRAAAQHWATWAMQKQELARNLISQHDLLLRNQGRTAEDLIGRYLRGAKSEVTKAEKYEIKKGPVVAAPAVPSVPTAPVSGAPVAPSASSAPSAGGALVSPVERAASKAVAGQAGASSSTMAGASALSATAGATAGAVSARAAEQQRLQRIVDAVARQEPRISWAAGLRDDGTTTLLVTDLAGGWIPPHVRLPANVTLLEPTARRRDADVIDLLGAVVAVAAHESNTYVAEPGPDAPALTGDRSARSAIPKVDEFGPTLVEAVRRRDSLPRIAQAIALPAVRKTGVLENEAELLHGCITAVKESVLKAYPSHELTAVGDWMLLAAIEALIDEQDYLANYHLAWYAVTTRRGGSRGFAA